MHGMATCYEKLLKTKKIKNIARFQCFSSTVLRTHFSLVKIALGLKYLALKKLH